MRALTAIVLSFFILLSSSGLAFAQHYCLGHAMLSKITLGEASLSCGMVMDAATCDEGPKESHGCCSNSYLQVDTDSHFAKVSFEFRFDTLWVAILPETVVYREGAILSLAAFELPLQRPPPPKQKRQVLYQTFLL